MLLDRFSDFLVNSIKGGKNAQVIAGVSGGPDSITMADLFRRCDIPIIIAHFNHGIRKEANADEEVVRRYAEKNGIRFESEHANIREIAARNKRSIEEQARISRYQFLFELARKEHANYVAVGHTADDQIETILMHLLRGTGISGLCGMSMVNEHSEWGEGITLIRRCSIFGGKKSQHIVNNTA